MFGIAFCLERTAHPHTIPAPLPWGSSCFSQGNAAGAPRFILLRLLLALLLALVLYRATHSPIYLPRRESALPCLSTLAWEQSHWAPSESKRLSGAMGVSRLMNILIRLEVIGKGFVFVGPPPSLYNTFFSTTPELELPAAWFMSTAHYNGSIVREMLDGLHWMASV